MCLEKKDKLIDVLEDTRSLLLFFSCMCLEKKVSDGLDRKGHCLVYL